MEWKVINSKWNLYGYTEQCHRLRYDSHIEPCDQSAAERYNQCDSLCQPVTIYLEWQFIYSRGNLSGYTEQCHRLRYDSHIEPCDQPAAERYNHNNDLCKSVTV